MNILDEAARQNRENTSAGAQPLYERIAEHREFRSGNIRDWLKEKDDLLREAAEALRDAEKARNDLRNEFAKAALTGSMAHHAAPEAHAWFAWQCADAMLAALSTAKADD